MDTLIRVRTELRYTHWRSYAVSLRILIVSICVAAISAFMLTSHHPSKPVKTVLSESYDPGQITHEQVADRYRDPSLAYFFGE